jgi:anaerobic magnesium-protoporphyrin IX monomethyl ester cyclase
MDIVFIHPGNAQRIYQTLANTLSAIEPPVWASLMANYARSKGFEVAIIDGDAHHLTAPKIAARVSEMRPKLAVIVVYGHQPSASTQNMAESLHVAQCLKGEKDPVPTLLVGGHVASLPLESLSEPGVDYVATGEGPTTVLDLIQALKSAAPDFSKVRGLGYRDSQGVPRINSAAPLITEVNEEMPGLAWDLLDMSLYRAHNWHCFGLDSRQPYASMYTSLGCPFHCSFCCIQAPFKSGEKVLGMKEGQNSYRLWSPQRVADQLEMLVERHGLRHLKIADEMFVLKREHVLGICDELIRRKLNLNIWAYARVDTVKEDMLDALRGAGVRWLAFGIESGNARVRKSVGKGIAHERVIKTIEMVRSAGIHVIGNYIFGLPEDDLESMNDTLSLAQEINCEFANFYCAMAYPGSPLYLEAVREGWPLPQTWAGYSQHAKDTLPLPTRHLTGGEVLAFRDQAFTKYFSDERYLTMVQRTFGSETRQQIVDMNSHRLDRQFAKAPSVS